MPAKSQPTSHNRTPKKAPKSIIRSASLNSPDWRQPQEYEIVPIRPCPLPVGKKTYRRALAVEYWREHIATAAWYSPTKKCLVAIMLDDHARIRGHYRISVGAFDTPIPLVRNVFGPAIAANISQIVLAHNLPAGDFMFSDVDFEEAKGLQEDADFLQMTLADYLVIGSKEFWPVLDHVNSCHCH